MNISQFVTDLLNRHGMTDAQLAELLGYKSKTSIVRIRSQQIGMHSLENFVERLRSSFQLTPEENAALNDAFASLYWQEDFAAIQSMKHFLSSDRDQEADPIVELLSDKGSAGPFLKHYESAREIKITLFNCHHVSIYRSLHILLSGGNAKVDHFLLPLENTVDIIDVFRRMMHVFYDSAYDPYAISVSAPGSHRGMLSTDFMVISYRNANDKARQDLVFFDRPDHGMIIPGTPGNNYLALLPIPEENRTPVKRTFPGYSELEDYVHFCAEFARLEHNRAIYKIKPDIGLDWIPTEILLSAVKQDDLPHAKNFRHAFQQLIKISRARTKNSFEKKQPTHAILKQSGMWNFIRTGKTLDHFWAMRPYTPRERLSILTELLHQARTNPAFHIYFLQDDHFLLDEEVILYEGEGLLMTNSNTDYNLAGGHVEMMMVVPEFCRLFRDYFTQVLLRDYVHSEEESCSLLQQMVDFCEEMVEASAAEMP